MTQGVAFQPTEENRRTVRAMSGYGVPHADIATMLRVDPKTLRKHFQDELERGSIEATAKVGQSLYRMATEGNSVAAAIFWMKARAGWREKQEVQVTAAIAPSPPLTISTSDPVEAARIYRRIIDGHAE